MGHLQGAGHEVLLEEFFAQHMAHERAAALRRVSRLSGRARLEEAVRMLSELGLMADLIESESGVQLRLSHCPLRIVVAVTKLPCSGEVGFVAELLGEELQRVSWMPAGSAACSYRLTP